MERLPENADELLRQFVLAFDIGLDAEARYEWMQKRLGVHRGAQVSSAYLAAVRYLRIKYSAAILGPTFPTCIINGGAS